MPVDLLDSNPYLQSFIYEQASTNPLRDHAVTSQQRNVPLESTSYTSTHGNERGVFYQKPFHAAVVVEPRLSQVQISPWTNVCHDNELMRRLLSVWLHCEYHFTAAIQKDLFLEDMAAQKEDFCSSLLVNIMLAYACVRYPRRAVNCHCLFNIRFVTLDSRIVPTTGTLKR